MPPPNAKMLMPSFFDRLLEAGQDSHGPQGYSLEQMISALRADLEDLLNTRQSQSLSTCIYPEVRRSILAYGLPDLNSIPEISGAASDSISSIIEAQVTLFEPRLRNVRAFIIEEEGENTRRVRFHIEGKLNVDPAPEVGFETVLELSTGHATIETKMS